MSTSEPPLRVTWLGHGAERTGPPIYLLRILAGLTDHHRIEPSVVLLDDGPLLDDFRAVAPTHVLRSSSPGGPRRAVAAGLSRLGADRAAGRTVASGGAVDTRPDVVVVNTAGSVRALEGLAGRPPRLVSHVHELATGLDYWLAPEARRRVLHGSDEIWVVADAVGTHLTEVYGVDPRHLRTHRGVLPPDATAPDGTEGAEHRAHLGVGPDDVLVGASGTLDWRKAPDHLLEVAVRATRTARSRLHFVWVGGSSSSPWAEALRTGARRAGLVDRITLLPEEQRPDRWFCALDLFLLTSREDAYPLVCLEAAAAGVPLLMFDSGGAPELVRDGGGVVVTYPDVGALAAEVAGLADDPSTRAELGQMARAAAGAHTVEAALPSLVADLRRVAGR